MSKVFTEPKSQVPIDVHTTELSSEAEQSPPAGLPGRN